MVSANFVSTELPHQVPRRLSDPSPNAVPPAPLGQHSAPPQHLVGDNNNDLPVGADKAVSKDDYDTAVKKLGLSLHKFYPESLLVK